MVNGLLMLNYLITSTAWFVAGMYGQRLWEVTVKREGPARASRD